MSSGSSFSLGAGSAIALGVLVAMGACNVTLPGASDANMAQARDRASSGAKLYSQHCSGCHGSKGQGLKGPEVMGGAALPEYPREPSAATDPALMDPEERRLREESRSAGTQLRAPFLTADDVHKYVSKEMPLPEGKEGSLTDEAYWDIVTFMLIAHGSTVPAEGVTSANAASISVQP